MLQWLMQSSREIDEPTELFLSTAEQARFDSFHFEKRRSDWLLGRWTAKCLVQAVLWEQRHESVARSALEIINTADGAPFVKSNGQTLALPLSISHSHGSALCAVDTDPIGVDLEWIEPRVQYFTDDYFTLNEQACVNNALFAQRDTLITGIWSAKEAVLKALHAGLSVDTRAIEISGAPLEPISKSWMPYEVTVHLENSAPLKGWWSVQDGFVLTLATMTNNVPTKSPTSPRASMIMLGADNGKGHGRISRRIAYSTRHHARHATRN